MTSVKQTTYVRTRGGRTVHLTGCWHTRWARTTPWEWAEGRSIEDIATNAQAVRVRLRWCRECFPSLPAWVVAA